VSEFIIISFSNLSFSFHCFAAKFWSILFSLFGSFSHYLQNFIHVPDVTVMGTLVSPLKYLRHA
jgi:hypothetical protein